jgi:tetratricopeptide (TPR) repeat protein
LGSLYKKLGRHDEAEKMYQRALQGKEKAWGPGHTSTLSTVNNLAGLYIKLGRLDEAEKTLQRALDGIAGAITPENYMTYVPALNIIRAFVSRPDHKKCESLRTGLASLIGRGEGQSSFASTTSAEDYSSRENIAESIASLTKLTWYQHRLDTNCKTPAEADT